MSYCNEFIFRWLLPHIACQVAFVKNVVSLKRIAVVFTEEENVSMGPFGLSLLLLKT